MWRARTTRGVNTWAGGPPDGGSLRRGSSQGTCSPPHPSRTTAHLTDPSSRDRRLTGRLRVPPGFPRSSAPTRTNTVCAPLFKCTLIVEDPHIPTLPPSAANAHHYIRTQRLDGDAHGATKPWRPFTTRHRRPTRTNTSADRAGEVTHFHHATSSGDTTNSRPSRTHHSVSPSSALLATTRRPARHDKRGAYGVRPGGADERGKQREDPGLARRRPLVPAVTGANGGTNHPTMMRPSGKRT